MPTILDLFSGCGGFSLGAHRAGFQTTLAIDFDPILSSSFRYNFPKSKLHRADIRQIDRSALERLLPNGVDGVIGGPPCQAFSEMGRRDLSDPRRTLVLDFFRIVDLVRPKFFVFENVRGLAFDEHSELLDRGLAKARKYVVTSRRLLNAQDFGAPTKRTRLFVVGFDPNEMSIPDERELFASDGTSATVADAIRDLASASEVEDYGNGFDRWKYDGRRTLSAYAQSMRSRTGFFSGHRKTNHTDATLKRFSKVRPGSSDKVGKYARLKWDGVSPTLRAGTGNDRGSYQAVRPLHPSEDRVITPREAARLQGFPDWFLFHPTVWHSCRMIGNSVSPILAKKLLSRVKEHLDLKGLSAAAAE